MLTVTEASHRMATQEQPKATLQQAEHGDWDSVGVAMSEEQIKQFVTLYRALQGLDDRAALSDVHCPRLAFADSRDAYGPRWGGARVEIGSALRRHREELESAGWCVELLDGLDHMQAMQAEVVPRMVRPWLDEALLSR